MNKEFEQNPRLRKLLQILLSSSDWITGPELAQNIGVTDRTIRNDINTLKEIVSECNASIDAVKGKGYLLIVSDKNSLDELLHFNEGSIPVVPNERLFYLCSKLILTESPIELADLEDELFVSQTTLENDLKVIKEKCLSHRNALRIMRRGNKVRISGDENAKRYALTDLVASNDTLPMYRNNGLLKHLIRPQNYELISKSVLNAFRDNNVILEDKEILNFITFMTITQMRIESGNGISIMEHQEYDWTEAGEQLAAVASAIAGQIAEKLGTSFNNDEYRNIIRYLMSKRIFRTDTGSDEQIDETIDPKYIVIVKSLLNDIKNEYLLDLTHDEELFNGLVLHIKALVKRLYNTPIQRSPILVQMKNEYPYIFELSMFCFKKIRELFGSEVNENDLSYISAHLGAAIERLESKYIHSNFTVALVSHLNYSASRWLLMKLKSNFNSFVEIKGPFSIFDKNEVIESRSTLVLTTLPLDFSDHDDFTKITISPLLSQKDIKTIGSYLKTVRLEFIQPKFPEDIKQYFEEDLFFKDLDTETPEETISVIYDRLYKKGYVPLPFLDSVLERERVSATSFPKGIAIPHPIEACSYRTIISVGILRKPIIWGDYKVKCVFFLAIRDEDKKYLGRFFNIIVEMTENKSKVQNIINSKNFREFIERIRD